MVEYRKGSLICVPEHQCSLHNADRLIKYLHGDAFILLCQREGVKIAFPEILYILFFPL